jgi:hypothetical protein
MFKQKILEAYVLYYELFEDKSFTTATWQSSKRYNLWHRILLVGTAARHEKRHGPVTLNGTYRITVRLPHGALSHTAYTSVRPLV